MDYIGKKESLTIELKSDDPKLSDNNIVEVVVGFANMEGGELYIGVEDDGQITGIHKDHNNPYSLGALISNKTVPPVSVRIDIIGELNPYV
ncbi:MAG: ATP-binding protein, partial [Bacteroidales bacterium]|nr:ATP-binding protein [Bacteroidales bacterium]